MRYYVDEGVDVPIDRRWWSQYHTGLLGWGVKIIKRIPTKNDQSLAKNHMSIASFHIQPFCEQHLGVHS